MDVFMWFEKLTGFREETIQQVQKNLFVNGDLLISKVNGEQYTCGRLEIPGLGELREKLKSVSVPSGKLSITEIVEDVQTLHVDNASSMFQVASQFNLLEMISPESTPEKGVDCYEYDMTQGPACAIAAGAGTIYRNYFVKIKNQTGQTRSHQIDCLEDIGEKLGNVNQSLWEMVNGYALVSKYGLEKINQRLLDSNEAEIDELRKLLRVGIQWNTEVTIKPTKNRLSQVYCSALPVAYSDLPAEDWKLFSQLILEATYECAFSACVLNSVQGGNNKLFLTLVGGGAFGNDKDLIINAIHRSLNIFRNVKIEVSVVSHGCSNDDVQVLIDKFNNYKK